MMDGDQAKLGGGDERGPSKQDVDAAFLAPPGLAGLLVDIDDELIDRDSIGTIPTGSERIPFHQYLPMEILLHIFGALPAATLTSSADKVCRFWCLVQLYFINTKGGKNYLLFF